MLLMAPAIARADELDLTESTRPGSTRPSTLAVIASGGSNFSPFGNAGGALSYFNEFAGGEIEAGAGGGFPGIQAGVMLRKLFGADGDYLVFEFGLAYNSRVLRGANPDVIGSGAHTWTDVGIGYEHRAGLFLLGFTGGIALTGFSQTPSAYLRASAGLAIF